jgi:hypothetical protein
LIPIYPLENLETAISSQRINKCVFLPQNLTPPVIQSVINRVISIGTVHIEFPPFDLFKAECCKPVIAITSVSPGSGKSCLSRSIARIVTAHDRKTAAICPSFNGDLPPLSKFYSGDPIPSTFPAKIVHEIQAFHRAGVSVVFVTADPRQAIIRAEQCADLIVYDGFFCEIPMIHCDTTFCVRTEVIDGNRALWPGLVNLFASDNVCMVSEGEIRFVRQASHPAQFYHHSSVVRMLDSRPTAVIEIEEPLEQSLRVYYRENQPPPLQLHFEAQVDILQSLTTASDRELSITYNESVNRESFCRLFLAGHLPPSFRVTTGEIVDCWSNTTGQLDVVIVNDVGPTMSLNDSVIAPIMADATLGVIEVKTTLIPDTLRKALTQLRPVKSLMTTHSTLELPDGSVVEDPLGGKILTGVFGFATAQGLENAISRILHVHPGVADFVIVPGVCGYFAKEVMEVCGIYISHAEIVGGYICTSTKGMELGFLFGLLNGVAALRRFSGSSCLRYLSGSWGGKYEEMARWQADAQHSLSKIKRLIQDSASAEQKTKLFRTQSRLFTMIAEVRQNLVPPP